MRKSMSVVAGMVVLAALLPACRHNNLHSVEERKMTVGLVQKEIRVGMSQAEVIAALGSPNIVSRDNKGKEAYIYDRIATEASYRDSSSSVGGGASVAGGGMPAGNVLLLGTVSGSGSHSRGKGQSATTQKTLTVVIRFDTAGMVESFSYHSSTF